MKKISENKKNPSSRQVNNILNILIFVLVVFSLIWMINESSALIATLYGSKISLFRYFTVQSNIFMGIIAIVTVFYERKDCVSKVLYVLKLVSTTAVSITFLVTLFYLGPTYSPSFFALYVHSNFFFHFAIPVLSIVVFVFFEKTDCITLKDNLYSLIPVFLYGLFYSFAAYTHMNNGIVQQGYDWYGFFRLGPASALIVLPVMFAFTFLTSFALWKFNTLSKRK